MKRSSVREHVIISYLEHRVEITARALKKAKVRTVSVRLQSGGKVRTVQVKVA